MTKIFLIGGECETRFFGLPGLKSAITVDFDSELRKKGKKTGDEAPVYLAIKIIKKIWKRSRGAVGVGW